MNKTEEIDIIDYFKDLRKFSLCPENNYLDQKIDINTLIIRASKIKLDPEEKAFSKVPEDHTLSRLRLSISFSDEVKKV